MLKNRFPGLCIGFRSIQITLNRNPSEMIEDR